MSVRERFLTDLRGRISEKSHINNTNKQIKGDIMSSFRDLHLPYMNKYGSIIVVSIQVSNLTHIQCKIILKNTLLSAL